MKISLLIGWQQAPFLPGAAQWPGRRILGQHNLLVLCVVYLVFKKMKKLKRASNKPKRRAYVDANEYERDLKRWKQQQDAQYANTNPAELSDQLLKTILSENNILQSGCRELREWRLECFRKGLPVKQGGHNRPNLKKPARLSVQVDTRIVLSIPRVLWLNIILPSLDIKDVFQLMKCCKIFYVLATDELFRTARMFFNHRRATPLAFSLWNYVYNLKYDYQRANVLKLSNRLIRKKSAVTLVCAAIEKHGYIEHLRDFADTLERTRQADEEEEKFHVASMPGRITRCNELLSKAGYSFDFYTHNRNLMRMIGDYRYFVELQNYVHMEETRAPQAIVNSLKHFVVYQVIEKCNLEDCINTAALSHLLDLISGKSFFGRELSYFQIAQYTQSIIQLVRYQGSENPPFCGCVWDDFTVKLQPMLKPTHLVDPKMNMPYKFHIGLSWWHLHTDYHSYHFIGP